MTGDNQQSADDAMFEARAIAIYWAAIKGSTEEHITDMISHFTNDQLKAFAVVTRALSQVLNEAWVERATNRGS